MPGKDPMNRDTHQCPVNAVAESDAINTLIRYTRIYRQLLKMRTSVTNQTKAFAKGIGDEKITLTKKGLVFEQPGDDQNMLQQLTRTVTLQAGWQQWAFLTDQIDPVKDKIEAAARQLMVWPWIDGIRGVGAIHLGLIIGQTGDLMHYTNPAKVWTRMGLGCRRDGTRQRRQVGMTAQQAHDEAYSPQRRAIMSMVGTTLLMLNKGDYRALYDRKREHYNQKYAGTPGALAHANKAALRYIEKQFLKHLWQQWRTHHDPSRGLPAP